MRTDALDLCGHVFVRWDDQGIGGIALHLRGDVKRLFFDWLRDHRPELFATYEELYARGAYAPLHERRRLAALARCEPEGTWPSRLRERASEAQPGRKPSRPSEVQQSLF
ncbi:MAG: hypothetical protein WKF48_05290 [Solirubrobacteraceae bacterium]